ncbi:MULTISPECIES: YcxB family protein [unclassified Novosphingobium]|uniref:YcxB family protein n=1 Tax=unclassified Novosphingobium TaxID=2644732 RepID=UPI00135B1727|nr:MULTISPECIES: YcxB family protein [unclassified Novosphingobium]
MPAISGIFTVALALLWRIPGTARKAYRELKFEGVRSLFTFASKGIESSDRFGKNTNPWSDFSGWAENERVQLLFRTSQMFYPVPRAQVAPDTLKTLRRAITAGAAPTKW